jgi:hypothetical protein
MEVLLSAIGIAEVVYIEAFGMEVKAVPALGDRISLVYILYPDWAGEDI